jgi:hypothetical protein
MIESLALLAKFPALLRRAEIRAAAVRLTGSIDCDMSIRLADHAHQLPFGLVIAAYDT